MLSKLTLRWKQRPARGRRRKGTSGNRNAIEDTDDVTSVPSTWSPFIFLSGDVSAPGQGPEPGEDEAGQMGSLSTGTAGESGAHALRWGPYPWAASTGFPGGQTARSKFLSQAEAQENSQDQRPGHKKVRIMVTGSQH